MNEERFIDTRASVYCIILNVMLFPGVLSIVLFAVNHQQTSFAFFGVVIESVIFVLK